MRGRSATALVGFGILGIGGIVAGCSDASPPACRGALVVRYDTLGFPVGLPWNNGRFEPARFAGTDGGTAVLVDADGATAHLDAASLRARAAGLQASGYVPNATCAALRALDHASAPQQAATAR